MQTVSIQTNNTSMIQAIQAMVAKLDPNAVMMTYDEPSDLSNEDSTKLLELIEKDDKGELKFHTQDEIIEYTNEILRKFGANI